MRHNHVTVDDIAHALAELSEVELVGHYGEGYHASLKFDIVSGEYRVYDHRELVTATTSAKAAAESYNDLRAH